MICVHQLLALLHDGCLWLGDPISITDMFLHRITKLPYKGANPTKEFGGKIREKELEDKMKELGLIKMLCMYFITSISYLAV